MISRVLPTEVGEHERYGLLFVGDDWAERHRDVEVQDESGKWVRAQAGLGVVLGARVLGEFGDDATRYAGANARKNYAGNSPVTRASGKKKTVTARWVRNTRLADPLHQQAFSALTASPGAHAYYRALRSRGSGHHAALRQLSSRLVGILHGCLKNRTVCDEHTAWAHHVRERSRVTSAATTCESTRTATMTRGDG